MNYYALIPLTAFFIHSYFIIYVFVQKKKNVVTRSFFFFTIPVALWSLADFMLWIPHEDPAWRYPLLMILSDLWMPCGFLVLNFIYYYTNKPRNLAYYIFYVATFVQILISPTTNLVSKGYRITSWGIIHVPGDYFLVSALVFLLPTLYCIPLLIGKMKKARSPYELHQMRLLLYAMVVPTISGIFNDIILPVVLHMKDVPQFASSLTVFLTFFIFRAVTRYNFLSVDVQQAAKELFDRIQDGVILVDITGKVIQTNKTAMAFFSLKSPEISSLYIDNLVYNYADKTNPFEVKVKKDDKTTFLSVSPGNLFENELPIGRIYIIRDITNMKLYSMELNQKNLALNKKNQELAIANEQIKKQEATIIQQEKLATLGDIVAGVAHEINTPLMAARIGINSLQKNIKDQEIYQDIEIMKEALDRISIHIVNLKDFIKFQEQPYGFFDVNKELNTTISIIKFKLPSSVEIIINLSENLPRVYGNAAEINQVFMNLIVNSIEAIPAKKEGSVSIRTYTEIDQSQDKKWVVIEIIDNGTGIEERLLSKMFIEKFSTKDTGTGLGLSLCKGIIDRHNGLIKVSSKLGEGTIMKLFLAPSSDTV